MFPFDMKCGNPSGRCERSGIGPWQYEGKLLCKECSAMVDEDFRRWEEEQKDSEHMEEAKK